MVWFVVKKIILILIASFFYFNLASAGLEGSGPVKLDSEVLKYFKRYLGAKNQQSTGALKHGRGDYFFISESGRGFGYSYCPQTYVDGCEPNPNIARRNCKKDVKEYLKNNEKCYLFARRNTIVWGGVKIKIPIKSLPSKIEQILKENNFLD